MDVKMKYRFEMSLVPAHAVQTHEGYFVQFGVNWVSSVWTIGNKFYNDQFATFTTLDGRCQACTRTSYFIPHLPTPVNLEDYM